MAEPDELGGRVREPMEGVGADEELGERESVLVTLAESVTLTEGVDEEDRHSVTVPDSEAVEVEVTLGDWEAVGEADEEGEEEGGMLPEKVVEPLRDTLGERETLIVGQLVAVPDEDRHRVDV